MKKTLIWILTIVMIMTMVPMSVYGTETGSGDDESASSIPSETYTGAAPVFPNAISQQAINLAWPYGTANSKLTYPKGSATEAFLEAIQEAYGDRKGWGKQTKAGASCDVFVGTVVRSCGYDKSFPRGLEQDLTYLPASDKFTKVNAKKKTDFLPGDIILYNNKGQGGHICVYVELGGEGYIAEASYSLKRTGRIARKACNWTPSNYKYFGVFRANGRCVAAIQKGGNSTGVKNLQKFLNWAGFSCGTADGVFGSKTVKAVKAFQKSQGLEVDGKFGTQSYAAARKYTNWGAAKTETGANVTSGGDDSQTTQKYTGKMPTETIKYQTGTKKNIKRWQKFLKWYGYDATVDGDFGKTTRKFTKKFQKAVALEADGVVGPGTVKKAKAVEK